MKKIFAQKKLFTREMSRLTKDADGIARTDLLLHAASHPSNIYVTYLFHAGKMTFSLLLLITLKVGILFLHRTTIKYVILILYIYK